jgi:hypothetical protein
VVETEDMALDSLRVRCRKFADIDLLGAGGEVALCAIKESTFMASSKMVAADFLRRVGLGGSENGRGRPLTGGLLSVSSSMFGDRSRLED